MESLILGAPVPQVVLVESAESRGKFVVIDGKQRLLTMTGMFYSKFNFWNKAKLKSLLALRQLEGTSIEDFLNKPDYSAMRLAFENQSVRAALISGIKSEHVLYDIFYRLNSGSVPLSGQELRQAIHRGPFTNYLFKITNTKQQIHNIMKIDGPDHRIYDFELILRCLAASISAVPYAGNLRAYLDGSTKLLNGN